MIFNSFSLAPADLNKLCRAIIALRAPNPGSQFSTIFAEDFERPASLGFTSTANGVLGYGWMANNDATLVVIDGARTAGICQQIVDGYSGSLLNGFRDPTNSVLEGEAAQIQDRMAALGLWNAPVILIAGYSAGGAVAPLVPLWRNVAKALGHVIRTVSFGAPRSAGTSRTNAMSEIDQKERYFFYNDPIAAFPLRSGTYTWLPFLIGIRASRRWAEFVHHRSGIQINANGSYTYENDPQGVDINSQTAWGVWWHGINSQVMGPHDIGLYAAAFADSTIPGRTHSGDLPGPRETPESQSPNELTRQERESVNIVREIQETQSTTPLSIPPAALCTAYRQGRVWYVAFGGVAIMSTPSRRRAQGMAREMNAWLRRMQQTVIVDTGNL